MLAAPPHAREGARLTALRSLELLDTDSEERFDRLTRLTQRLLNVPIALVTLVDDQRQWFKSNSGLDTKETSRDISFCGHAVANEKNLIVEDALNDDRFADNPLVVSDPNIRSYAGVPLYANGYPVGTLCAIDTKHHEFADEDISVLEDLARMAEKELSHRQDALIDELTGLLSRKGLEEIGKVVLGMAAREHREVMAVFGDLNGLKMINDTYGHLEGDRAIIETANAIAATFRSADAVARLSGDEFCILMMAGSERFLEGWPAMVARLDNALREVGDEFGLPYALSISLGSATEFPSEETTLRDLISRADTAMYAVKKTRHLHPESPKRPEF